MYAAEQYRPPGRSNRLGRSNADHDVFEGLPVKQWDQSATHVSLAPPKAENAHGDDKWAEPPLPRDYQLLQPWTQQLLRLARSGKVGTKRKADPDALDDDKAEEEMVEEVKHDLEQERGFLARKWKPVPEALLEPEHRHFEFLAKRRKGMPSLYGGDGGGGAAVPLRKTKVQRTAADGDVAIYEVLVPEGRVVDGEVAAESAESVEARAVAPGTVIEGIGVANEDGVIVTEHSRAPAAPRRNRPPPKRKGGPGRGKKRVTFTNPDGSTYTTIVPNATKIVPQPGQTVQHVAKGVEAQADGSELKASAEGGEDGQPTGEAGPEGADEGNDDGEGSDDGDEGEEGDDGDDDQRDDAELSDEDAPTAGVTPAPAEKQSQPPPAETTKPSPKPGKSPTPRKSKSATPKKSRTPTPKPAPTDADAAVESATPAPPVQEPAPAAPTPEAAPEATQEASAPAPEVGEPAAAESVAAEAPPQQQQDTDTLMRDASSSPELPLARTRSDSRQGSAAAAAAEVASPAVDEKGEGDDRGDGVVKEEEEEERGGEKGGTEANISTDAGEEVEEGEAKQDEAKQDEAKEDEANEDEAKQDDVKEHEANEDEANEDEANEDAPMQTFEDGEEDLLGGLEKSLGGEGASEGEGEGGGGPA